MRNPSRPIAEHTARTLTLACLACLLAFAAYSWVARVSRVLAEGPMSAGSVAGAKIDHAPLKLQLAVEGDRSINFGESRDLQAEYVGPQAAKEALESGSARATALASSDFDEDGMPDLLSGYASPNGGGIVTLRRGNVDSVYPNTAEAFARKQRGEFVDLPFLSPAIVFELGVQPDFLGAGDFDADGHWDVVAANKGGTDLHFLKGDGRGHLAEAKRLALPGAVTALVVGEINRADGLDDVVVGVVSAEGARALVFESPLGALRGEPEVFALPAPATALGLGLLDEHYAYDLAIGAGREVNIVIGRDRKLSLSDGQRADVAAAHIARYELAAEVRALAVGDFTGEGMQDVAALTADGELNVVKRNARERAMSVPPAVAGGSQPSQHPPATAGGTDPSMQSQDASAWQVTSAMTIAGVGASSPRLIATSVSPRWEDDLLLVDGAGGPMRVLVADDETSYGKRKEEGRESVAVSPRFRVGASLASASLDVEGRAVVAALPMRLNIDGLKDLVVLRAGESEPSVLQTEPTQTFTVNTPNHTPDANPGNGVCADANGDCSLRAAAQEINADPSNTVAFGILFTQLFFGPINPNSEEGINFDRAVTIDGSTTDANGPAKVRIHDSQPNPVPPNTFKPVLLLNAADSVVRDLDFTGAKDVAVLLDGRDAIIEGGRFGFTAGVITCTPADRNNRAIYNRAGSGVVGGTNPFARNLFGCNIQDVFTEFGALGLSIQGNYFGLDDSGNVGMPTVNENVSINSANNSIGGPIVGAGNFAGRGSFFIRYFQSPDGTNGNLFQGNQVGLNAAGTAALSYSQWAIDLNGAPDNTIGGTTPTARNVITNSAGGGINLGLGTTGTFVQMNFLGLGPDGSTQQPNGNGVFVDAGATDNTIGGGIAQAGNLISSNLEIGVLLNGDRTFVASNCVGTDVTGNLDRGNGQNNVLIRGANFNVVWSNVLSAGKGFGPLGGTGVTVVGSRGTSIRENIIGLNKAGTQALGNIRGGVLVFQDSFDTDVIGNVVSGNGGFLAVEAFDGTGNKAQGNIVGLDITGVNPIPNANHGVAANIVGGLNPGERNRIAFNGGDGVFKLGGEYILRNSIFKNGGFGISHTTFGTEKFPVIMQADNTNIQFTLNSQAQITYRIEFFASDECNAPAPNDFGEGQSFIGATNVTTDANSNAAGNFTPAVAVSAGKFATATATRLDAEGNPVATSSFSQCRQFTGSMTSADLSITKTASPNPVSPGGEITYTITVTNAGPNGAGDVVVGDFLPVGTTYIEGSCSSTGGGKCIGFGGLRGITFDSLGIGASATITLRARVDASIASGTLLTNFANVGSAITPDPSAGNNTATATTTVGTPPPPPPPPPSPTPTPIPSPTPSADLSIIKTATPDPVAPGELITYTITITNNGPDAAANVRVEDTIPSETNFFSCMATGGGVCSGSINVRIDFPSLGSGAQAVITLRVRVFDVIAGGTAIRNTATVGSGTHDPNPNNNSSSVTVTTTMTPPPTPTPTPIVTPTPTPTPSPTPADLSITKSASPDPVLPGANITYAITVTNNGPDAAADLVINDSVPAGTTFSSCANLFGPCVLMGNLVNASRPALAHADTWTITVVASVNLSVSLGVSINNQADVTSATPDPVPANNSATTTTHTPPPSVVISEFRTRGLGGVNDEFIELFNRSAVSVDISGWRLMASTATGSTSTLVTVNNGTTLPAGGHFLATNSAGYSGATSGDQTYNADVPDDGGIALLMPGNVIADQVGLSAGSAYREGTTLAPLSGNLNQSYERKPGGASSNTQDTNDNQNDFLLRSPSDPQNLNSAIVPLVQFSAAIYSVAENAGSALVTVTRTGDLSSAMTVDYATSDGTATERNDYTTAVGKLRFAAGETSKTFTVLLTDDLTVETVETVNVTLSNPMGGFALGSPNVATLNITSDDTSPPVSNPIDDAPFFVERHYHDFLNRPSDPAGKAFWTDQITSCGADTQCRDIRRINVSAAFFLSIEFQQTGFLVYRAHQAAFDTGPTLGFRDFLRDTQEIGRDVVVGQPGWEQQLEANTQAFFSDFVNRPQFLVRYPLMMTAAQYVDALNANTGGSLTQAERDALMSGLTAGTETRASVLRAVAEDADFNGREFNRAFVFMQYLGYLRREPNSMPDMNFDGYNFWLAKLNQFNGNFIDAEMVKAFIVSIEFRQRFGP